MLILGGHSRRDQLSKKEFKWPCQGLVVPYLFGDTQNEHVKYFLRDGPNPQLQISVGKQGGDSLES